MAGLVHEWWLYSSNGLRVTDYTILLDFLLILPVMSGVISTIAIILLGCGILLIPKISEYVALGLCVPLVALPVLRRFVIGLGMVRLSLMGPIIVGYCKYNVEKTCATCQALRDIDPGSKNPVTVLTDPPLQHAGKLVLVGSNSNYMFFKSPSKAGDDSSGVKAVPLTRIVCVGKDGCEAKATEPAGLLRLHRRASAATVHQRTNAVRGGQGTHHLGLHPLHQRRTTLPVPRVSCRCPLRCRKR